MDQGHGLESRTRTKNNIHRDALRRSQQGARTLNEEGKTGNILVLQQRNKAINRTAEKQHTVKS